METSLYWISDLTFAVVLSILLWHSYVYRDTVSPTDKAVRGLFAWCIFFCLQDAFWGFAALKSVGNAALLFTASSIFHMSTIITANVWLYFVLVYLRKVVHFAKVYRAFGFVMIVFQFALVFRNFFTPTIFSISSDCLYQPEFFRPIVFVNQYLVYVVVAIVTAVFVLKSPMKERKNYFAVFMFVLAPLVCGVFQMLYTDGPFYSIGYLVGCCIIHVFIAARERNERLLVASQTDGLTGVQNRNAYEKDCENFSDMLTDENLIVFSIDVNGLKQMNDTMGHYAGDELIVCAASCITSILGIYGKIYRIGGDEFMAIIHYDGNAQDLKQLINDDALCKKGECVGEISLSIGYAERRNLPSADLETLKKAADRMMYLDKETYYKLKGVDRRGQREAFNAVCCSYTKILKVNLTTDSYGIIQVEAYEKEMQYGFSTKISEWLKKFGLSGLVHPADLANYLQKTNIDYLRSYFKQGKFSFSFFYRRRKPSGDYDFVMMEILRSFDYDDADQNVFLYVKNIGDEKGPSFLA